MEVGGDLMSSERITLQLPTPLYNRLKQRAEQANRSVEAEVLDALVAAVPLDRELSPDLESELSPLSSMTDDQLRQAARSLLDAEDSSRPEELHSKRQREGLNAQEDEERAQ